MATGTLQSTVPTPRIVVLFRSSSPVVEPDRSGVRAQCPTDSSIVGVCGQLGYQLVVANHDLLLRWPPDYPAFAHVVVDEGHELGGVAEGDDDVRGAVIGHG